MDGNPLRRGIDRAERAAWIILALAFLASAPLVVPLVGRAAKADGLNLVRQERSWREVDAVLQGRAPREMYGYGGSGGSVWVSGRWRAPSGRVRSGLVPAFSGAPAGTVVKVWVTPAGQLTSGAPLTGDMVGGRALAIEMLVAGGLAAAAALLGLAVRWLANRRRMAYWGLEWACIGPRWSSRR